MTTMTTPSEWKSKQKDPEEHLKAVYTKLQPIDSVGHPFEGQEWECLLIIVA
jgi:hypothetical protein